MISCSCYQYSSSYNMYLSIIYTQVTSYVTHTNISMILKMRAPIPE